MAKNNRMSIPSKASRVVCQTHSESQISISYFRSHCREAPDYVTILNHRHGSGTSHLARLKYLDAKKQNGIASDSVVSASVLSLRFSHVQCFATLRTVAQQVPQSMGFSRQEYWNGLPCPPPGDLPDPGIKSESPALQADLFTAESPGKPSVISKII